MADPQTSLEIVRFVNRMPEQVWTLWTQPDELARWWWPERFQTMYDVDVKPGGSYRFKTIDAPPMGVLELAGMFTEVDPPSRLSYTWRWAAGPQHESEVTVRSEGAGSGTNVIVSHHGLKDSEDRDNHIQGWNDCLARLSAL